MTIRPDHIAHKSTTDSESLIATAIEPGGTDACFPGELVCERQASNVYLHSLDSNNSSERILGHIKNENKGSITISNNGEGPSSMILNQNSVTAAKIPDGVVENSKIFGPISFTKGGTGQTTVMAARRALLPNIDPTVLLMHFNEPNGSTVFVDSSRSALTGTATGTVSNSTAQSRFGGASAWFTGTTSSYITVGPANSIDITTDRQPFTVEAWVYPTTPGVSRWIIGNEEVGTAQSFSDWHFRVGSTGQLGFFYLGGGFNTSSPVVVKFNTWNHVFASYGGGTTWYAGVNGNTQTFLNTAAPSARIVNSQIVIGGLPDSSDGNFPWIGYIDEVRITKGYALYPGPYSMPTAQFPDPVTLTRRATLGTSGTSARWQNSASEFKDFDDVGSSVSSPFSNQYLKWNSGTLEWTPSERVSRTGVLTRTETARDGELATDEDALLIATNANQWQKVDLSTW